MKESYDAVPIKASYIIYGNALARPSRNQRNLTKGNEANEEKKEFCLKCAILLDSTAEGAEIAETLMALE